MDDYRYPDPLTLAQAYFPSWMQAHAREILASDGKQAAIEYLVRESVQSFPGGYNRAVAYQTRSQGRSVRHDRAELLNSLVRPVSEISPTLQTILSGKEVIVYNAAYDFRILWQSCLAAGISPVWLHGSQWTCAMERYAAWQDEWNDHRGSYRWQKLPTGDHSAAGDCRVTLDWTPGDDEAVYDDGQVSTTANWRVFQELTGRYRAAITNALVQSGACPAEEAWAAIFYLGSSDAEVSHCLLLNLAERTIYSDELGPGLQYVTGALAHSRHGAG